LPSAHVVASSGSRYTLPRPPSPATHPLSLHDALPICRLPALDLALDSLGGFRQRVSGEVGADIVSGLFQHRTGHCGVDMEQPVLDRKSTRLNSSHVKISYAVFCLKKKILTHSNVDENL